MEFKINVSVIVQFIIYMQMIILEHAFQFVLLDIIFSMIVLNVYYNVHLIIKLHTTHQVNNVLLNVQLDIMQIIQHSHVLQTVQKILFHIKFFNIANVLLSVQQLWIYLQILLMALVFQLVRLDTMLIILQDNAFLHARTIYSQIIWLIHHLVELVALLHLLI